MEDNAGLSPIKEFPILDPEDGIPLFYPHIPQTASEYIKDTLNTRWIGQGPKSALFEDLINKTFCPEHRGIAVNSGTSALHLAYLLAGISESDEVLCPVFTCTATNLPILYCGAKPVFVDIDPLTFNIDFEDLYRKKTKKTKAIVCVDYGGLTCDYKKLRLFCDQNNLLLISDAAHSLGAKSNSNNPSFYCDFIMYSFQAIKTITTGDGGFLGFKDHSLLEKAKRLRWFGIDRAAKQNGIWENDIYELGYKYQLSDVNASMGLAALDVFDEIIRNRRELLKTYVENLSNERTKLLGFTSSNNTVDIDSHGAWLCTITVDKDRAGLMNKLRLNGIESSQVHYRNDRYSVFSKYKNECPMMDKMEDKYLIIPMHTKMNRNDVLKICDLINLGW
jgi:dTDP-4-amino-4,6-dideoxygalactose transaminase